MADGAKGQASYHTRYRLVVEWDQLRVDDIARAASLQADGTVEPVETSRRL